MLRSPSFVLLSSDHNKEKARKGARSLTSLPRWRPFGRQRCSAGKARRARPQTNALQRCLGRLLKRIWLIFTPWELLRIRALCADVPSFALPLLLRRSTAAVVQLFRRIRGSTFPPPPPRGDLASLDPFAENLYSADREAQESMTCESGGEEAGGALRKCGVEASHAYWALHSPHSLGSSTGSSSDGGKQ